MLSLRKKRYRFNQISNSLLQFYNCLEQENRKKHVVASGILNTLWDNWNNFWRTYWLVQIRGGYGFNRTYVSPLQSSLTEYDALSYLISLIGRNRSIYSRRQEPTWGDYQKIQDIASALIQQNSNVQMMNIVLSTASLFGTTIKHIQIVRNALIHLHKENIDEAKQKVVPYYLISRLKYPYELLESQEMQSQKNALKFWIDEMNAFLNFLN